MITNERDLLYMLSAETQEQAKRHVYKHTNCGAWIEFYDWGIRVGSIVEGCDFGTMIYPLRYPFTEHDYELRIHAIEEEAGALWEWANLLNDDTDAPDVDYDYRHLGQDGRSA